MGKVYKEGRVIKQMKIIQNQSQFRVCSIKCVKVKSIKLNNFDHGKTTIKKAREEITFGRNHT